MKKTILIALFALVILTFVGICVYADPEPRIPVTYKAKFTTPVDFPDGYGVFNYEGLSKTVTYEKGTVLSDFNFPSFLCSGDIEIVGWDVDPNGYKVEEEVTFTLTINNDGTVPAFFRAVDENDKPFPCLNVKSLIYPDSYMSSLRNVTVFVKTGEKLENGVNIPITETQEGGDGQPTYVFDSWTPDPVGYVMTAEQEFVCRMKPVAAEDVQRCKLTFRAEFTTPMEVPDGYSFFEYDTFNVLPNERIDDWCIPKFRYLGDGMTFLGWNKDPLGAVVFSDTVFTAKFNNDDCVPVFFRMVDEDGKPLEGLKSPTQGSLPGNYDNYVSMIKKGEPVSVVNVPAISEYLACANKSAWDAEPIGYIADEPHEFTFTYKYYYMVTFSAWQAGLYDRQYIRRGEAAVAPADPQAEGWLFTGWDCDFDNVTEHLDVCALMYRYGNCNLDDVINTSDAVAILKHCADIKPLTDNALLLADANMDKSVNTADAVKVLKIAAGMDD